MYAVGDKLREMCSKQFGHVQCRLTTTQLKNYFLCTLIATKERRQVEEDMDKNIKNRPERVKPIKRLLSWQDKQNLYSRPIIFLSQGFDDDGDDLCNKQTYPQSVEKCQNGHLI